MNNTALPHAELELRPKRPFATIPEVAGDLGLEGRAVYRLIREGVIPPGVAVHLGRKVLISREAWARWVADGGAECPGRGSPEPERAATDGGGEP